MPAELPSPQAEAQLFGSYGAVNGVKSFLDKQILDPASPWCGTDYVRKEGEPERFSWDTGVLSGLLCPFTAGGLAGLADTPAKLNPFHGSGAMARRAALTAFYHLSSMPGDNLPREGNLFTGGASYPIIHAFFVYGGTIGGPLPLVKRYLDDAGFALWAEGAKAVGDKLADYQGYESNQWSHNLHGHLAVFMATGEKRFLGYFERQMNAYVDGAFGANAKFGQHPAGFYLEEFGCDGNYDNMNLTAVAAMYQEYKELPEAKPELVAKMKISIEKNLRLKSFLWLTNHEGAGFSPSGFNSRVPQSSLFFSDPAGDYLASREFDLGLAKAKMVPMPAKGTFPACVFPYYVTTDEWARRLISEGLASNAASGKEWYGGQGFASFYHLYQKPIAAKAATVPIRAESGLWELPGLVAWKKGGLYGVVFHDVAGADAAKELNGVMGGGPTALWSEGTGSFVATMANKNKPIKATNADEVTFSCVYGETSDGVFFYSGKERSTLRWIEPGKIFEITAELRSVKGTLIWRYELKDNEVVIDVNLKAEKVKNVRMSIPLPTPDKGVEITSPDQGAVVYSVAGKGKARLSLVGGGKFELTPVFECGGGSKVRCCRAELATDGTPTRVSVRLEK